MIDTMTGNSSNSVILDNKPVLCHVFDHNQWAHLPLKYMQEPNVALGNCVKFKHLIIGS